MNYKKLMGLTFYLLLFSSIQVYSSTVISVAGTNDATRLNTQRKIARDPSGNIHVVWQASGGEVWYAKSIDNGVSWRNEVRLGSNNANHPSIAVDEQGQIHIVWSEGSPQEIYYSRFTTFWTPPQNISNSPGDSINSSITIDQAGNILVVWRESYSGNDEIYFTRFNGSWETPRNLSNTLGFSNYPSVVADSNSAIHVVWNEDLGGKYGILHTMSADGGINWSSPSQIVSQFISTWRPSMVAGSQNNIHVVYGDADGEIYYIKYNGSSWSIPVDISNTSGSSASPTIGVDLHNNLYVAWVEDIGNLEIFWSKYLVSAGFWQSSKNFSNTSSRSHYPNLPEKITTENIDIVWTEDYSIVFDQIYAHVPPSISMSLSPSALWPPNHKLVDIHATVTIAADDDTPSIKLLSITSSEPDNGLGDGDKPNDIQEATFGTADFDFKLRAERSGTGQGRKYTITYEVTDSWGNRAQAKGNVLVPHDQKELIGQLEVTFDPNPVYLGNGDAYTYKVQIKEVNGIGVTLKELWIYYWGQWWDHTYYLYQWFPRYIPAFGRAEFTNTAGSNHKGGDVIWKFIYDDDNGHKNLASSGTVYLR